MKKIPVRHIKSGIKEPDASGRFIIWSLSELLAGKDMVQELHRHSFYFILILEKGRGEHIIDFIPYPVVARSTFLMRPGQVHQLRLEKDCKGYLLQFPDNFFLHSHTISRQIVKKVSQKNYY